jgi:integrase
MSRIKPKKDRNIFSKDGEWFLDFTFKGKRIRQFGGATKEAARNALAKIRVERLEEKLGLRPAETAAPIPFEAFADEFLEVYSKQNKRSWKRDEILLNNLKRFFKGSSLQTIGPEQVERFKAQRKTEMVVRFKATKKTPISPATVNRELACLKTLFSKAEEWGRIEKNPIRAVRKFKENNSRERILSAAEAARLVECAAEGLRPVLIVALNTGMRRNEILSLKWKNVDFPREYIFIEDSKSGKSRKIPMNAPVIEALRALPRDPEFVFYNPETKDHVKDVKTAFYAACRRAKKDPDDEDDPGIVGLRFHDLRHTAFSMMVEGGVDIVTVSKIAGHASIQMTMRYAHPTPENMKRAVERLAEVLDPSRQKVDTVTIPKPATASVRYN